MQLRQLSGQSTVLCWQYIQGRMNRLESYLCLTLSVQLYGGWLLLSRLSVTAKAGKTNESAVPVLPQAGETA